MDFATKGRAATDSVYLLLAQGVVLLVGYLIHILLARLLGPESYGIFSLCYGALYVLILFVISGVPAAASRRIAVDRSSARAVRTLSLRIQILVSFPACIAYVLLAEPLAGVLADHRLGPYLSITALAIPAYALLYAHLGFLAGLRLFSRQALLIGAYGLAKLAFVIPLGLLFGAKGALAGVALAPASALVLGSRLLPRPETELVASATRARDLLSFALPWTVLAVALQLLLSGDLFLVKALLRDDATTGYYSAAATIGRVPYLVLAALSNMLLPLVAHAVAAGDRVKTNLYVRQATRLILILGILATALSWALAEPIITLLFSPAYAPAAGPLPILVAGTSLLALFCALASIQAGARSEWHPALTALVTFAAGMAFGSWVIPAHGIIGAALTTLAMGLISSAAALGFIARTLGVSVPLATAGRCLLAAVPLALLAVVLRPSTGLAPPLLAAESVVYVLALVAMGEVDSEDWRMLARQEGLSWFIHLIARVKHNKGQGS